MAGIIDPDDNLKKKIPKTSLFFKFRTFLDSLVTSNIEGTRTHLYRLPETLPQKLRHMVTLSHFDKVRKNVGSVGINAVKCVGTVYPLLLTVEPLSVLSVRNETQS